MAKNALAPRPTNALSRETDPMQTLLREAAERPQYGQLVDYLSARRMMPPIAFSGRMGGGEFTRNSFFGNELPRTGEVTIGHFSGPTTVVHELTHAADHQIDTQYHELKQKARKADLTLAEQQFVNAYERLSYKPHAYGGKPAVAQRKSMAQTLDPAWTDKHSGYRATNVELPAWGMGATQGKASGVRDYRPPLHLDPTMATEFSILLDLARKAQPVIPGR